MDFVHKLPESAIYSNCDKTFIMTEEYWNYAGRHAWSLWKWIPAWKLFGIIKILGRYKPLCRQVIDKDVKTDWIKHYEMKSI